MAGASAKQVDFSNVKERGNFSPAQVEAGDYLAKITKVEDAKSKDGEDFMYLFTIKLNKFSQNSYPYYCKLSENQLWKLRNILIAAGISVPKSKTKVDPNRVVGKTIGVTMEDDEYEGKMKSVVAAVFPAAELADSVSSSDDDEDEDDYEEPETDEVEDEEEEGEDGDDLTDLDRLELRKILKQLKPEITTSKSQSDDEIRDLIRDARADAEPAEEDEEEDEPEPPKKKKPAAKAKKKKSEDVSDEELEELDIDDL